MNTDIYGQLILAMGILLASGLMVPLFGGARRLAGWLNFLMVTAAGIILMNIAATTVFTTASQSSKFLSIGGMGVYFMVDGVSGFFMAIIAFMAIMSAFYSIRYMEHYTDYGVRGYYFHFPLFILGMIGIVTVDDLSIGFTVSWQLMTIASYFLIRYESKKRENVRNANKYLGLMELAWLIIFGATFLIDGALMGDSLHTLTAKLGMTTGIAPMLVFGLLLLGFSFKAGVFPLGQLWLPDAHSIAPSPISSLLSGVMIKTGVYGIIRTFFWMVPHGEGFHFNPMFWGTLIASFGVVTLFIGTVQSMKQNDYKRLLAYSSIGQIGYIIFAIGAALFMLNGQSDFMKLLGMVAIIGVLYHVLNHAVFKGLLFLSSGSILYATHTKDLNMLGGLMKFMPVTAIIAGIASLSIAGVPPFSGFASKWTIISTSLLAGSEMLFLVIFGIIALFTSAITLACYVKFFGMSFASSGSEFCCKEEPREVPFGMLLPKVILGALCLVQGLIPYFYYTVITGVFRNSAGSTVFDTFNSVALTDSIFTSAMGVTLKVPGLQTSVNSVAVPAVMLAIWAGSFALAWMLRKSGGSQEKTAPTWLCGYQELNDLNRYKNRNMFAGLRTILRWTGGNVKE